MDNILALHGLIAGLKATDKQALIDIVNNAEANESTIKTNIANALNSKTGSNLNSSSAWIDIQNAISGMTNKKWASGTAISNTSTKAFLISNKEITANYSYINVNGLAFQPSIILIMNISSGSSYETIYYNQSNIGQVYCKIIGMTPPADIQIKNDGTMPSNTAYITSNSFLIPVYNMDKSMNWVAIE